MSRTRLPRPQVRVGEWDLLSGKTIPIVRIHAGGFVIPVRPIHLRRLCDELHDAADQFEEREPDA